MARVDMARRPGRRRDGAATQPALLGDEVGWKLDHGTRDVGRRGVAEAREALRRATSGSPSPSADEHRAA